MSIPWGILQWAIEHPELGWIFLFFWLLFELRSKRGRVYQLDKKITGAIIVVRALAKQEDAINEDKVDDYLVENGMKPEDFFRQDNSLASKHIKDKALTDSESSKGGSTNSPNNDERST